MALGVGIRIMRDATAVWTGNKAMNTFESGNNTSGRMAQMLAVNYLDSPASTSALTYKTQGAVYSTADSRTSTFQIDSMPAQIILMEIGA
jgi:hypothetical protein